jgi:hypothetical protein
MFATHRILWLASPVQVIANALFVLSADRAMPHDEPFEMTVVALLARVVVPPSFTNRPSMRHEAYACAPFCIAVIVPSNVMAVSDAATIWFKAEAALLFDLRTVAVASVVAAASIIMPPCVAPTVPES